MSSNSEALSIIEAKVDCTAEKVGYDPSRLTVLDRHLLSLIEEKRLQAASYLVSRNGKVFAHKSMGRLKYNDETKKYMPDTIWKIASITKVFTAVSILKLVEDGKIHIQQPVATVLEEFKTPAHEGITIFHLLTHTSGVMPDPGAFFEPYPVQGDWYDKKEWIKELLRGPLAIAPGMEYRYSSACFMLLAEIVSRVSGMHYEKYVLENIIKPLGMADTFFDIPVELADRVCFNSKWQEDRFYNRKERPEHAPPRGSGGLSSSLRDLQKIGQMLINKGRLGDVRILSRKAVEAMTRKQVSAKSYCWGNGGKEVELGLTLDYYSNNTFLSPGSFAHEGAGLSGLFMDPMEDVVLAYICPFEDGMGWDDRAVINVRNIVWSGIL